MFRIEGKYFYGWSIRASTVSPCKDLGETLTDTQIRTYAAERDMIIVSKDTNFSDRVLVSEPPPRVIHIRYR
ncbi:hypothetical protein Thiowin_03343 [Thiorhodovibrio winogradskyi]|uniref:DUF5615 domain-containing protein n=1 Tax=Thiorhodovibrio winogradskyi TaxID=77007 RepID=A0ABZ0SCT1_9GAMM